MPSAENVSTRLRDEGVVWDWPSLTTEQVDELRSHLERCPMYASHVSAKATVPPVSYDEAVALRWPVFAPTMRDLVLAPHWLEYAISLRPLAQSHFGDKFARLYSLNAFWTAPADGPAYQDTQAWHRDGDSRDQLTAFMLGTDVLELDDGAHLYQRGTHRVGDDDLGWHFREEPPDPNTIETILGPRGTLVLEDTGGLHKALRPTRRPRLLVWARWSTENPPASYGWDSLSPVPLTDVAGRVPEDPELREAVRLVVA